MSTRRDLVWFQRALPLATYTTVSKLGTIDSVTANSTNTVFGQPPPDAHKSLIGKVERVIVWNGSTFSITGTLDVLFFTSGTDGSSLATESYIGHESFVATDYVTQNTTVGCASGDGLGLDYYTTGSSKKFHIGLICNHTLAKESVKVKWAWRADRGEP
jgi:hypothetical protein